MRAQQEAVDVVGARRGQQMAVGGAKFDHDAGAGVVVMLRPDVDVAIADRLGEAGGEQLAAIAPDDIFAGDPDVIVTA